MPLVWRRFVGCFSETSVLSRHKPSLCRQDVYCCVDSGTDRHEKNANSTSNRTYDINKEQCYCDV